MNHPKVVFFMMAIFTITCCKKQDSKEIPKSEPVEVNQTRKVVEKTIKYTVSGKNYQSFVAYSGGDTASKPVVFIIPEWWGLNEYIKYRARKLAELGYFVMALDFYGDGKLAITPQLAKDESEPFYRSPELGLQAFKAGESQLNKYPNADQTRMAVMGYCFGGAQALNLGRQIGSLKGVISFHGNLMTGVKPNNSTVKYLVLNGGADKFVSQSEINDFKYQMDSAKINYQLIDYPGALHAFTNPSATEVGKKYNIKIGYNADADEKSWEELVRFLSQIFH